METKSAFDPRENDLPLKAIGKWSLALLIAVVVLMALVALILGIPTHRNDGSTVLNRKMSQPTLQSNGDADMRAYKASEEKILTTYAWVDKASGKVRIPVEKAIEIIAAKGLPHRGDSTDKKGEKK